MRVEELTAQAILVELSGDDMKDLNITYEQMDYADVETKRVIWTVLSQVNHTLGRTFSGAGRLTVEAMRRGADGCVLLFTQETLTARPKRYLLRQNACLTAQFSSLDAVYACAEALRFSGVRADSRLYRLDHDYRLLLRQKAGANRLRQCLNEFGAVVGESEAVALHTAEHWTCLIAHNALEALARQSS
ncbi:MAG: adaptor protein MecA [Clostridia bacterium]|nr:adaptor protein MecA [Clostridia bacterium]